jgi:hypothetical protein
VRNGIPALLHLLASSSTPRARLVNARQARLQLPLAELWNHARYADPRPDVNEFLSRLTVKNKFRVGDEMELVSPRGNRRFCLQTLFDKHGQTIDEALGGGWEVQARLPGDPGEMALLTRFFA